jgi:hypothetical protein
MSGSACPDRFKKIQKGPLKAENEDSTEKDPTVCLLEIRKSGQIRNQLVFGVHQGMQNHRKSSITNPIETNLN